MVVFITCAFITDSFHLPVRFNTRLASKPTKSCSQRSGTEGARTQRSPTRGTAKRLWENHAKPRPLGRVLRRFPRPLGFRGFPAGPGRHTANVILCSSGYVCPRVPSQE